MPWSNQSGGGGWKGGGNGPWGQPPRGPQGGGGGNEPPDLEELLRRGQDKIRRLMPGGGRSGGPGETTGMLTALPLIAVAAVGFWLYQSIYVVQPDQVGVELLFGKAKAELNEPGIHFAFWPFEQVETPALLKENQDVLGGGPASGADSIMLSGDQNLVSVEFSVLWRISDPAKFLFRVADQPDLVRKVSESVMREVVGRTRADEFRTTGREVAQTAVRELVQQTLDSYDAGISITAVNVTRADPPLEVQDAFGEVQRAQQDQDKFKQDAQAYANKRLGEARGESSQIREAALGYRDQVIAEATGGAQRFTAVREQYEKSPEITRERIYLETMEGVLAKTGKVILDGGATQGVLPYLPLPEVGRPLTTPSSTGAAQ